MLLIMMQTDKTDRHIKTSNYSKGHRCIVVLSLDTAQFVSNAQDPRNFTVIGEQVHYNFTSEKEADEWRLLLQKAITNSTLQARQAELEQQLAEGAASEKAAAEGAAAESVP